MPESSTVTRFPPQLPVKQIATAAQALIDLVDALGGDPDGEDATGDEDAFEEHGRFADGAGCNTGDPGGGNVDDEGELVDEREPDHDAEIETWSHYLDHPPELHIGTRPGWNDGPEAA